MGKESLTSNEVRDMMLAMADRIIEAEPILTDADRALGDGDHGIGMERGMNAVKEALEGKDFPTVGKVFMGVGMAMMSSMGGASGAVFGTLFRSGGKALGEATAFTGVELATFFKEGLEEVPSQEIKRWWMLSCLRQRKRRRSPRSRFGKRSLQWQMPLPLDVMQARE